MSSADSAGLKRTRSAESDVCGGDDNVVDQTEHAHAHNASHVEMCPKQGHLRTITLILI